MGREVTSDGNKFMIDSLERRLSLLRIDLNNAQVRDTTGIESAKLQGRIDALEDLQEELIRGTLKTGREQK